MIKEYLEKIDLPCLTANMNSLEKRNKGLEITQTSEDMKRDKSTGLSGFYLKIISSPPTFRLHTPLYQRQDNKMVCRMISTWILTKKKLLNA